MKFHIVIALLACLSMNLSAQSVSLKLGTMYESSGWRYEAWHPLHVEAMYLQPVSGDVSLTAGAGYFIKRIGRPRHVYSIAGGVRCMLLHRTISPYINGEIGRTFSLTHDRAVPQTTLLKGGLGMMYSLRSNLYLDCTIKAVDSEHISGFEGLVGVTLSL